MSPIVDYRIICYYHNPLLSLELELLS